MDSKSFTVTWSEQIYARDKEEAAHIARLRLQRDDAETFDVSGEDGYKTTLRVEPGTV